MTRPAIALLMSSLVVALAMAAVPVGADAAACKRGQARWKIQGKTRCVKARSLDTKTLRPVAATEVQYGIALVAQLESKKLAKVLRRRATSIAELAGALQTQAAGSVGLARAARYALRQSETTTFEQAIPSSNGVSGKLTASANAETGLKLGVEATARKGADSVKLSMDVDLGKFGIDNARACPDASGRVVTNSKTAFKITTIDKHGSKVISAKTIQASVIAQTVGQNGPDGFLKHIATTQTVKSAVYQRGLSYENTTVASVGGAPDGAVTTQGTPSSQTRIRSADLTRRQEQAYERQSSADGPSDPDLAKKLAETSKSDREEMKRLETRWTTTGLNYCVEMVFDPETVAAVEVGQTLPVTGIQRISASKAPVGATWTVSEVEVGAFAGNGAGPASGKVFSATGGGPKDDFTVAANVLAASPAGRVARRWLAKSVPFPTVISGTITQSEAAFTGAFTFSHTQAVRWMRTSYQNNPDGSRSGEYTQDQSTVTSGHWKTSAGGCTWEGDVSGGALTHPQTMDLTVDAQGNVSYGFAAETDLGQRSFPLTGGPPGCPGSTDAAQVNAHATGRKAPDSSLYAAPPGALQGKTFHVAVSNATDTIGNVASYSITMSWTLDGS